MNRAATGKLSEFIHYFLNKMAKQCVTNMSTKFYEVRRISNPELLVNYITKPRWSPFSLIA